MAWVAFHLWKQGQMDAAAQPGAPIDFDAAGLEILLLTTAGGAPPLATTQDIADLLAGSPAEVTGTNYARKPLSGNDITLSTGVVTLDASDPAAYAQSASGFSDAKYSVLYKNVGSVDANSPVVALETFTSAVGNTTGSLTLQFSSSSGIFTFT